MGEKPESRLDRFLLWSLFVLPAACGTLSWVTRDRIESGMGELVAFAGWGCGALTALSIIFDYYQKPPGDR